MLFRKSMNFREKWRRHWKAYYKSTYRIAAFVACAILMVMAFPDGGRFVYDFEDNRPWRNEDLVAPFEFPILKDAKDLAAERDSLRKVVVPYYRRDSVNAVAMRIEAHSLVSKFSPHMGRYCPGSYEVDTLAALLESCISRRLVECAEKGILETSQEESGGVERNEVMLVSANIVEPCLLSEISKPRDAYIALLRRVETDVKKHYQIDEVDWVRGLLKAMPIAELIIPNVHFDKARTDAAEAERLNNVALYSGKVMMGEHIIRQGELVTPDVAQKLLSLKEAEARVSRLGVSSLPTLIGKLVIVGGLLFSLYLFLYYFRRDYFRHLHYVNFILMMMCGMVALAGFLVDHNVNVTFVVPYVVLPIMTRIFTDSRMAVYVNIVTVLIISFFAYNSQLFILLHVPAGLLACISLYQLNKRIQLFRTAVYMFVFYSCIYVSFLFWQKGQFFFDDRVIWEFAISSILMLLVYPLIYLVEKIFGFVSDVSLLELTDGNNELLRQLSEKAPGTFQHSMQVANLGQEVAYKLGANALLVRAGALYHDIGKILNPMYFTENQVKGMNPHSELTLEQSAQLIIGHVKEGVRLAKKYNVPSQVRDIIASHHGTTLTRYFYLAWCSEHPDEDPDMSLFSYPGPTPRTKEEAIIMMADAVEAASKSMTSYTDDAISALVDKIVDIQMSARQFHMAPLTFAEIDEAKTVLKEKLRNIYHARIKYPDERKGNSSNQ